MLELALIALSAIAPGPAGSVQGTILSEGTGEPLAGVHITLPSGARLAISHSDGTYAIEGLPAGRQTLLFAQFGFHDLAIEVVVPPGGSVRLDVQLRPRPIAMPAISVVTGALARTARADGGEIPPPGSRHLTFSSVGSATLSNEPDVLTSLEAVPGVGVAEAFATSLHVRGGAADQNQILLDGVPVYNASHASGVFTGINPDAVAEVAVHTGVAPARHGGGLSSTVDITTRRPGESGLAVHGGIGLGDLRSTVETPLPGGGGLLLAGRRTTYDFVSRGRFDREASTGFDEVLAKFVLPAFGGEFDLLSLHGSNRVSYFANTAALEEGSQAPSGSASADWYNRVRWTTDTDAVTWRWSNDGTTSVRTSVWRAETETWGAWGEEPDRTRFDHGLTHIGLAAEVARTRPSGQIRAGIGIERLSTSYTTWDAAEDAAAPPWEVAPHVVWSSAFVDHRWIPHDRWLVDNGVRFVVGAGRGVEFEPRVSVHYRPFRDVALSLGYARLHQYAQSLRNEESPLHAAFGFEPLVATDEGGVPVARSDQVTGTARIGLTEGLELEIDAYTRTFRGLLLVAPATEDPFVVDAFATGGGAAYGIGAGLGYRGTATDMDLAAEWTSTTREVAELEYTPTFQRSSLVAGVSRAFGRIATVRAAFRAATGRPTSGLTGGFAWEPFDTYTGEVEFAGTPQRKGDELNRERLPAYARLDLGLRRTWHPSFLGSKGLLVTWLDVLNVLDRKNALALQESSEGWSAIALGGLSVALGIQWSF